MRITDSLMPITFPSNMKHLLLPSLALLLAATCSGHAQQRTVALKPELAAPAASPPVAAPQPTTPVPRPNPDVLSCQTLTGHVTNNANQPLTGATVMLRSRIKGFSAEACITNAEGEYLLTSRQPIPLNTLLEISAGGYDTFAQPLTNCQPMEASLEALPGTRFKSDGRIKKTSASGKIH